MKAYKCDVCETYLQGSAAGVLYDNSKLPKSTRYDLCGKCLEDILKVVKGEAIVTTSDEDGEPDDYRKWGADIPYRKGELVRFQGRLYEILTDHVSSQFNAPGYCEKYKPVEEPGLFHPEGYGMNAEA